MRARIRLVVGLAAAGIVASQLIGCERPSTDAVSPERSESPSAVTATPATSADEPTAPTPTVSSPADPPSAGSTLRFVIASDGHLGDAKAGNVRAVFNGHDHDQVGVKMSLGVRYFFDGHVGGHWGTAQKTFRKVELSPNGLTTTVRTLSGEELNRSSVSWN